jgi:hypothetical protein
VTAGSHTPTVGDPHAQAHLDADWRITARMHRVSARQRVLVLTFPDAAQAEAWDRATDTDVLRGLA